ncbi:TPA: fibronectin-bing protein SfbII [Streptococcus pyogenes]|uniref:PrtF2 n=1 Tax=Streptococcus pyogenes TaxID=1314 RepID=Q6IZ44_STRPY|nr:fibronectin-bing protein SfbII [Streptococcus pyogenes]HER4575402.1 fibronectin-bing protein SfbII [Streptococcus pyogenes NGAS643]HER4578096.1 fibronectin-bing protein SfbII [Streptococcus pyogenes NGAS633]HER4583920.1 fibronectin-bing protein SfbII [Streptococcus pyogenes NGAS655]HER4676840.1 fibronectin-bing protein SfbII [Streptococcus pyogenes NGAS346]HER4710031.1 fibronectin-bing protein SfbII [Streptococcus pyogenes NGAS330]HER4713696.1 fibronectin-bing protein SfbII [Streptococcus 
MTQKNSYKLSFLLSLTGFILGLLLVFIGLSGVSVGHAETRNGANKQGAFEIKKNKSQEEYNYEVYDNRNILQDGEHKLEIKRVDGTGKTYQGFCFQLTKNFPTAQGVSKKLYKKLSSSDEETLKQYASKYTSNRRGDTSGNLKKQIAKVLTEGYPTNKSNWLNGLTENEKIEVTQDAIWYFTETTVPADRSYTNRNVNSQKMKEVYQKLIDTTDIDKYEDVQFDLFVPQDTNLQAVISVEPVIESLPWTSLKPIAQKDITAKKIWVDAPKEKPIIYFKLYRQLPGEKEVAVDDAELKQINSEGQQEISVTWTNQLVTDEKGMAYIYSVKEVDKNGELLEPKDYIKKEDGLTVTNTYVKPTSGHYDIEVTFGNGHIDITEDTTPDIVSGENQMKQIEGEDSKPIDEVTENNLIEFGKNTMPGEEDGTNSNKYEEVEDSRPVDTLSGLSSEQGQSGDMTIEEDSATHIKFSKRDIDGKELAGATMELRDSSGKTISTWISDGQVKDFYLMPGKYTFVETAAPDGYEIATAITFTVNEQGQVTVNGKATKGDAHIVMVDAYKPTKGSGQVIDIEEKLPDEQGHSGSTTEIEDSKSSDLIIGGQGEVVDTTEDTQSGMTGHSASTTEIEDSKSSDVIVGGQGQIVETTEDTQTGMHGDSGRKTEVEDTKLVQSFHFDNKESESNSEIPKKDKPKSNTSLPATGEKQHNKFFWMVTSCSLISSVFVISLKTKKCLSSC